MAAPVAQKETAARAPMPEPAGTQSAADLIMRAGVRMARVLEVMLGIAFIGAVCLNFANVVGRYLVGVSIFGADEVQAFVLIWMTFLGAAIVGWRNQNLRMDVLAACFPASVQTALKGVEILIVVVLAVFVSVASWSYTATVFSFGQRSDLAEIPMWIPHAAVAVGFGLIALTGLWRFVRFLGQVLGHQEGAP